LTIAITALCVGEQRSEAVEVHRVIAIERACRCDREKIGAGEGIRTLDPVLGKVVLYA
jgi:hypothetical protein